MPVNNTLGIFPAAGALGTSIYKHVLDLKLVPPCELVLISRNPEKTSEKYRNAGVVVRQADYDDSESLKHAFDGISCLHLISYPTFQHHHRTKAHKQAIDAARRSGVSHILYSSLAFAGDAKMESVAHVMLAHLDTEKYLVELGDRDPNFTFTIIRQGIYSSSFPIYTANFALKSETTEILLPHDGTGPGVAWAKRDELGEASARLTAAYYHSMPIQGIDMSRNKTFCLTGPRVFSLAETAEVLGKVAGRHVKVREVSIDEYIGQPSMQGFVQPYGPVETGRIWATAFDAIKSGETAAASSLLSRLLGRAPEPFDQTVAAIAASM